MLRASDLNPILDEGSPTSTGSIHAAILLCNVLALKFNPEQPRNHYSRGWGCDAVQARPILYTWTLSIQDLHNRTIHLSFDLCDDYSPLIIGLDVQRYSKRSFLSRNQTITIQRPENKFPKCLPIYLHSEDPLRLRAHVVIIGLKPYSCTLLVSNRAPSLRTSTLAKRLHRYTHAGTKDMVEMLRHTDCPRSELIVLCKRIVQACPVCVRTGIPLPSKKVSITHVCEAFNQEIQADFTFVNIRGTKYCVLHIVDAGTGFSEACIVQTRSGETMAQSIETLWILSHGAPASFSADSEFTRGHMRSLLTTHNIKLNERPVRRHNKTGIMERKHRTVKAILERLQNDVSEKSDKVLLA